MNESFEICCSHMFPTKYSPGRHRALLPDCFKCSSMSINLSKNGFLSVLCLYNGHINLSAKIQLNWHCKLKWKNNRSKVLSRFVLRKVKSFKMKISELISRSSFYLHFVKFLWNKTSFFANRSPFSKNLIILFNS